MTRDLRADALAIWSAGVASVDPFRLVRDAGDRLDGESRVALREAPRVIVVGGGKAGPAMAAGLESLLTDRLDRVSGLLNVPEGPPTGGSRIRLHPARPAGSNHPTAAGVAGCDEMLGLLRAAGPDDVAVCLLSGGGSALLPSPVDGISLADKQLVTHLLHECGATIHEMNAVRKHLSRVKGGRLAGAFRGRRLISLIISDVVGDPLDVIASGPTAPDPTTFADAVAVLDRHALWGKVPGAVRDLLTLGTRGLIPETVKALPPSVVNVVVGSNAVALAASRGIAEQRGYRVLNFGSFVEGETREVAVGVAGIVRSITTINEPIPKPACILIGGETTVSLSGGTGKGGRNQEFVLAAMTKLGPGGMKNVAVLSGGTDGEDGPTDAAGAVATTEISDASTRLGLDPDDYLRRHDAYPFFDATGGLIRTGLTGTNVMDVRVILVS